MLDGYLQEIPLVGVFFYLHHLDVAITVGLADHRHLLRDEAGLEQVYELAQESRDHLLEIFLGNATLALDDHLLDGHADDLLDLREERLQVVGLAEEHTVIRVLGFGDYAVALPD